eukprot:CAMPEP_0174751040 /NCGR_PEP_ID=MMETSP1094-20130205/99040_1 /TAXON_ID=156173 /ORGANISM="Chrysochromulina brevifilum, Strain UTEX LB 985" /LENGTH=67 /DNA_ID=CAMNT_0015956475 /DNA_START=57 /DNA_END=260 /DNA_ORIENTATION=+
MIRRRHHCRACGQLVCSRCSLSRQTIISAGITLPNQRVCDHCMLRSAPAEQPTEQQAEQPASSADAV